jgi:hypothetical protein
LLCRYGASWTMFTRITIAPGWPAAGHCLGYGADGDFDQ